VSRRHLILLPDTNIGQLDRAKEVILLLMYSWVNYQNDYSKYIEDCLALNTTPCLSLHNRRRYQGEEEILKYIRMV
jgi:hypothetical protein